MTAIPRRILGRTEVEITVVGYGAFELRGESHPGERRVTSDQASLILNELLDSGINYIDTSPDYGWSETFLGRFVSHRRDSFFLASKCGCPIYPSVEPRPLQDPVLTHSYDRKRIVDGVNQSLKLLRTDHLDLLQLHHNPSRETLERYDTIDTLLDIQRQGKARFIGCSSELPNLESHIQMGVFDAFLLPYSALDRENESAITKAAEQGAGIVVRSAIGPGNISEKRRPGKLPWETLTNGSFDDILDGMSPFEFILRFSIANPYVTSTVVGTIHPSEFHANLAAARRGPLPEDVYQEAISRLDALGSSPT
jgi:aryl-alcohol dehydrogenase-like predicted oxidoreductase